VVENKSCYPFSWSQLRGTQKDNFL